MAAIGDRLLSPEPGWRRYDDNNPAIMYVGTWQIETSTNHYGGAKQYTTDPTGKIRFLFQGTKIRLIIDPYNNKPADVPIAIDGISETFSEYQSSTTPNTQNLRYEKTGLNPGIHVVEIGPYPNLNTLNWNLDAIDIDADGRLLHPQEKTSLEEVTTLGDRIRCHYQASNASNVGLFNGLGRETSNFIPSYHTSTAPDGDFYFIYVRDDHRGHKIFIADRAVHYGVSWDVLNVAGIATQAGVPLLHNIAPPLVAGFPFDEVSGNTVYDLTGQYIGTLFGTTITTGWNGQQRARSFNGTSDYINFSSQIIPTGKKSIRLKIKVDSVPFDWSVFMTTGYSGSASNRMLGAIAKAGSGRDGELYFTFHSNSSTPFANISTGVSICDGKWHDILLTWDGTANQNSMKLYMDDMTTPITAVTPTTTEGGTYQRILIMGSDITSSGSYYQRFKGVIDEFEVYSDVIDPTSDSMFQSKYEFNLRLLTGGLINIDKDNEWDQIIVNSNLGGTITPGDNRVWNWSNVTSLTSTVGGSATGRVRRGGGNVYTWTDVISNTTSAHFRPVLVVGNNIPELPKPKYLLRDGAGLYSLVPSPLSWQQVGTGEPQSNLFTMEEQDITTSLSPQAKIQISIQPQGNLGQYNQGRVQISRYGLIFLKAVIQ